MPVLSAAEVAAVAAAAGSDWPLTDAVAYAGIESGFDSDAVSPTGCVGLWQICPPPSDARDPARNALYAHQKWLAAGGTFDRDWTPYDGGRANPQWGRYFALAQAAVQGQDTLFTAPEPQSRSLAGQQVVGQLVNSPWFEGQWEITQGYGTTQYDGEPEGHGQTHWHAGVDVGVDCGTTIVTPVAGTVRAFDNPGGYGTALVVLPDGAGVGIVLGHLRQRLVDDGQQVLAGQPVAISNSTGNSTGCHVHFEVRPLDPKQPLGIGRYGTDIDPSSWLLYGTGSDVRLLSSSGSSIGDAIGTAVERIKAGGQVLLGSGLVLAGLIAAAWGLRGGSVGGLQRETGRQLQELGRPPRQERPRPAPQPSEAALSRTRADLRPNVKLAGRGPRTVPAARTIREAPSKRRPR